VETLTKWDSIAPFICDAEATVKNTSSNELTNNEALKFC